MLASESIVYMIIYIVNWLFMEIIDSIGSRLRKVRTELGYTQTEFAEVAAKAGVAGATRQSQANYEKGRQMPGAAYLAAIARVGADVTYILTGYRVDEATRTEIARMFSATAAVDHDDLNASAIAATIGVGEDARRVAEDSARYAPMSRRELALLDNYRAADEAGKKALETTGAALAQPAARQEKHGNG